MMEMTDELIERLTRLMMEPLDLPVELRQWLVNDMLLYQTIGKHWRAAIVELVNDKTLTVRTHHEETWHTFSLPVDDVRYVCNLSEYGL